MIIVVLNITPVQHDHGGTKKNTYNNDIKYEYSGTKQNTCNSKI